MKNNAFLITCLLISSFIDAQSLVTYPAPEGYPANKDFTVRVRSLGQKWQNISVYLVKVDQVKDARHSLQSSSMAYFDFSGIVEVAVTYNKGPVRLARIRPLSYELPSVVKGNTISFSLSLPRKLSVEVNGDIFHNLQLLANPIETARPNPADSNIIYYGPGIHQVGTVKIATGKTVYIAGGAIVQGQLVASHVENVHILGRGILYQSPVRQANPANAAAGRPGTVPPARERRFRNDALIVEFSKNVEINGLIVVPNSYTVLVGQSEQVIIRNLSSFSAGGNNDGIDVFCSSGVAIENLFMRNSDDCIAIYGHRWAYYGNTKNVTVRNSILWADVAHPILIGTHGDPNRPDTLEGITFSNIEILDHNEAQVNYQGCMSINAGDNNMIRHVRFENFHIEDIREGQLVNLRVMYNKKYNTAPGRAIEDIYFKNISYNGTHANLSVIAGYDDDTRSIKHVVFENLRINGKLISETMPGKPAWFQTSDMARFYVGEHVEGVSFLPPADAAATAIESTQ